MRRLSSVITALVLVAACEGDPPAGGARDGQGGSDPGNLRRPLRPGHRGHGGGGGPQVDASILTLAQAIAAQLGG